MSGRHDLGDLEGLLSRAEALAGEWGGAAAAATTPGRERAVLRLFGVHGVDREDRPLAAEVIDRHLGRDRARLAAGIALPFAMAMAEYDLGPQELALEVASGAIDLALEAELLADPGRRATAEAEATGLARAALDRVDANRVARRELRDLLGRRPRPLVGTSLQEPAIVDALDEAAAAVTAGVGLVRVEVPAGRELAQIVARTGGSVEPWRPGPASRSGLEVPDPRARPVPTGSQRALAVLRRALDEAAAERGGYLSLATSAPALAAPEQAVVAAFERVDLVAADPMREIVTGHARPDRALADHAFAHDLLRRAGAAILIAAGPLVVGPDLARGVPSDPGTRSGRALALQVLAAMLARRDGLLPRRVLLGALPDWTAEEASPGPLAAAEITLRRALLPEHPLAFVEPPLGDSAAATWGAILGALLADAGPLEAVLRRGGAGLAARARGTRAAAVVGRDLAASRAPAGLTGTALEHARRTLEVAVATLDQLAAEGWPAVLGALPTPRAEGAGPSDDVVVRAEPFDPFTTPSSRVGAAPAADTAPGA